jgi:hypothetical protein
VGLTKRGRNDIFEVLARNGIDLAQVELEDLDQVRLIHWPTMSEFKFNQLPAYKGGFNLSVNVPHGFSGRLTAGRWEDVLGQLAEWADEVRYVAETPDLWAELKRVPKIPAETDSTASNTLFTTDEQAQIKQRLDEVKSLVREEFELTNDQLSAVDKTLDDAKEASERLGRKDWRMLFYGAFLSVFLTDAIPPSVIQTVLATVVHGIGHLFGFGDPPSMITT